MCGILVLFLSGCTQLPGETHVEIHADGSGQITVRKFTDDGNGAASGTSTGAANVTLTWLNGNPAQAHRYTDGDSSVHEESVEFDSLSELVLGDPVRSESVGLEKLNRRFLLLGENRWRLRYRAGLQLWDDPAEVPGGEWSTEEIELWRAARKGERLSEFWNLPQTKELLETDTYDRSQQTIILTAPSPIRRALPLRAGMLLMEPTISGNTSSWTIPGSAAMAQRLLLGLDAVVEFYADMPIESAASQTPDDATDAGISLVSDDEQARQEFIDSRFRDEQLQPALTALELGACKEAFALLEPLAEDGHSDAQGLMVDMYFSGVGVGKDEAKELEWMMRAAESGHEMMPAAIGLMLAENPDEDLPRSEMQRLLEAAADKDHPMARLMLTGISAQEGAVDSTDPEIAARIGQLMISAAHYGAPGMGGEISDLYETGDARGRIPKDLVSAYAFKSIQIAGREPASSDPRKDLERLANQLTDAQIEEAQALAARVWNKRPRFAAAPLGTKCHD